MGTFRLIRVTLLMVILTVNFTACGGEEEEQTIIGRASLTGKWQSTWEKIHKVENGKEVVISDGAYTNTLLEPKADGTCIEGRVEGGCAETSHWSSGDSKLTLSYSGGYSDVLTVNELTATKLVFVFEDWDSLDDGSLELDDITTTIYKKIDRSPNQFRAEQHLRELLCCFSFMEHSITPHSQKYSNQDVTIKEGMITFILDS